MEGFSSEEGEEVVVDLSVLGSGAGVEGGWGSWVLWMRLQYLDVRLDLKLNEGRMELGGWGLVTLRLWRSLPC
jgi:hypothetical protein